MSPEDFAERIQGLVDLHNLVIPFESPESASRQAEIRAGGVKTEDVKCAAGKGQGKRASASVDGAKGKGKVSKVQTAKNGGAKPPAGPANAGPCSTSPTSGAAGAKAAPRKRKQPGSAGAGSGGDTQERPTKSANYCSGSGGSSGKILHGALTPVSAIKDEADDDNEENTAWDALLSVCAQMPRQKTK